MCDIEREGNELVITDKKGVKYVIYYYSHISGQ